VQQQQYQHTVDIIQVVQQHVDTLFIQHEQLICGEGVAAVEATLQLGRGDSSLSTMTIAPAAVYSSAGGMSTDAQTERYERQIRCFEHCRAVRRLMKPN
jgi:hypothetical protein